MNFNKLTENPKVSIVTPSYNQGNFLEHTILSVLLQDYENIEYIIIDGGSSDNSVDIIKKYENKIKYWVSEKDKGQSDAINKGFSKATGEIFYWVNSDDFLMPSSISIIVDYFKRKKNIGMIYGDRIVVDKKGNIVDVNILTKYNNFLFKFDQKLPQETAFFRSELWKKVGGLKLESNYCMDTELWMNMNKFTNFYHIPFFLAYFRVHKLAKSSNTIFKGIDFGEVEVRKYQKIHFSKFEYRIIPFLKTIILVYKKFLLLFENKLFKTNKIEKKIIMNFIDNL
jgi:glycosyltransferase involved in cell wall biosynthesis